MPETPEKALERLLSGLCGVEKLRRLLLELPGGTLLVEELPAGASSTAEVIHRAVVELKRMGMADEQFFGSLFDSFPRRRKDIERVAALWDVPPDGARAHSPVSDGPVELHFVFAASRSEVSLDIALEFVRELQARYPSVRARLVEIREGSVVIVVRVAGAPSDLTQLVNRVNAGASPPISIRGGLRPQRMYVASKVPLVEGHPIRELAVEEPEAAVFRQFHKELPTATQLAEFKADLANRAIVDPRVNELLQGLPKDGHPIEWLIAGLCYLGMTGKTGDYREDALNLIARSPELIANIYRTRSGWGGPNQSQPELGLVENFVQMMGVPGADPDRLVKLLRVFYVLHMDHGNGDLSTFTGKAVASGLADQYSSLAGAMAALFGPRHGRANQDVLDFVREVGTDDHAHIEKFVRDRLSSGRQVIGFGQAVLRTEDPRFAILYALGEDLCPKDPLFRTAAAIREVVVRVFNEHPKVHDPRPTVDALTATLLNACGLTDSDYYSVLQAFPLLASISAMIVDEHLGLRKIATAKGPIDQHVDGSDLPDPAVFKSARTAS